MVYEGVMISSNQGACKGAGGTPLVFLPTVLTVGDGLPQNNLSFPRKRESINCCSRNSWMPDEGLPLTRSGDRMKMGAVRPQELILINRDETPRFIDKACLVCHAPGRWPKDTRRSSFQRFHQLSPWVESL